MALKIRRKLEIFVLVTFSLSLGVQCHPRKKLVNKLVPNENRRSRLLSSTLLSDYWKERGFHDTFTDHLIASESSGKDFLLSGDELVDFEGTKQIRIPRGHLSPPPKLPQIVSLTASVSIPRKNKRIAAKRRQDRRRRPLRPLTKAQRKSDMEILESVTLMDGGVPTQMADGSYQIRQPESPLKSQRKYHQEPSGDQSPDSYQMDDETPPYVSKDDSHQAEPSIQAYHTLPAPPSYYHQPQYQGKPSNAYKQPKSLSQLTAEQFQQEVMQTQQQQPHQPQPGYPQPTAEPLPHVIPLYLIPKAQPQPNYQHPLNPPLRHQTAHYPQSQPSPTPYSLPPAQQQPQYPQSQSNSHQPHYPQAPSNSHQHYPQQPPPPPSSHQQPQEPRFQLTPSQEPQAPQGPSNSHQPHHHYPQQPPPPPSSHQYTQESHFQEPPSPSPQPQPSPSPTPSHQAQLFQPPSSTPESRDVSFKTQLFQQQNLQQFPHPFGPESSEPSALAKLTATILSTASGAASAAAKVLGGELPSILPTSPPPSPPQPQFRRPFSSTLVASTTLPHLAAPMLAAAASIQSPEVLLPTPTSSTAPTTVTSDDEQSFQTNNQLVEPEDLAKKITTIYETGKKILYFPKGVIDTVDTFLKQMERNPMVSYWGDKFFAKVFGDTSGT